MHVVEHDSVTLDGLKAAVLLVQMTMQDEYVCDVEHVLDDVDEELAELVMLPEGPLTSHGESNQQNGHKQYSPSGAEVLGGSMHHGSTPSHPQGREPLVGVGKGHKPPLVVMKPGREVKNSTVFVVEDATPEEVDDEGLPTDNVGAVDDSDPEELADGKLDAEVLPGDKPAVDDVCCPKEFPEDEAEPGELLNDETWTVMMVLTTVANVVDTSWTVLVKEDSTEEKPESAVLEDMEAVPVACD
ncbi:hypothetical protein H2200_013028 [Cladophialophora chaetospira]|uniref:Uncharacterized protein n=1 Tax=Cladophialophora chaetospira TaxID=386627 RepID=A0AA38WWK8_9EURO|nr:hypothetical protein H2200_013028 [Cladophialophora chaetospira]